MAIDPSNMQLLYFLKAMDDMRYPENGWHEKMITVLSAGFHEKKSGTIFQVENKWRHVLS